ncbi:hypothetical protein GH714_028882 [Hevea brasiliensis]|uniref:Uncharacterized protein n=1 Tax=Hevea brasiliensis TaxID=3981 RepID=A0A6A6LMK8_HEVBR|nr:hypothetical protein GH714_028882 [Hevea brasiliensis]
MVENASDMDNGASMASADVVDEKSANSINNSSTVGVVKVDLSGQNLKKDEKKTSILSTEKGEVSNSEASGRVEHQSYENKQKSEVTGSHAHVCYHGYQIFSLFTLSLVPWPVGHACLLSGAITDGCKKL